MAKIEINEDVPVSEMPTLLSEVIRQLVEGRVSGFKPEWAIVTHAANDPDRVEAPASNQVDVDMEDYAYVCRRDDVTSVL